MVTKLTAWLRQKFPEQRLFLKSDEGTRFLRISSGAQVGIVAGGALVVSWAFLATAMLLMQSLGAGGAREQALREQAMYGERLNALSQERDMRAEEAHKAQERFYLAMAQISDMQARLLASEERRSELETGIEIIQATLRRTMSERDEALETADLAMAELEQATGTSNTQAGMLAAKSSTIAVLSDRLLATAEARDGASLEAHSAETTVQELVYEARLAEERTERVLSRLEEAVTASLGPLQSALGATGLPTDRIIEEMRRTYSGQGGPLVPLSISTKTPDGEEIVDPVAARANDLLGTLDEVALYRMAAENTPLYQPVQQAFRFTSGFGYRRDPKTGGRRMHNGTDFAAPVGTPIHAAAAGIVRRAAWTGGYGRMVEIEHAGGVTTRYAHLSRMRVSAGDRVSQGQRIGDMGSSGRSTGSHLHYEVRLNGTPRNPMTFIRAGQNVF